MRACRPNRIHTAGSPPVNRNTEDPGDPETHWHRDDEAIGLPSLHGGASSDVPKMRKTGTAIKRAPQNTTLWYKCPPAVKNWPPLHCTCCYCWLAWFSRAAWSPRNPHCACLDSAESHGQRAWDLEVFAGYTPQGAPLLKVCAQLLKGLLVSWTIMTRLLK